MRLARTPVVPVALQHRMGVLQVLHHLERAGARRMQAVLLAPALERGRRRDAARDVDQRKQECGERLLQAELDRVRVDHLHGVEHADLSAANGAGVGVAYPLQVVANRFGVEVRAVVKLHPRARGEHDGAVVLPLPGLDQPRNEMTVRVDLEQRVVDGLGRRPALKTAREVRVEGTRVGVQGGGQGAPVRHRRRRAGRVRQETARHRCRRRGLQELSASRHLVLLCSGGRTTARAGMHDRRASRLHQTGDFSITMHSWM